MNAYKSVGLLGGILLALLTISIATGGMSVIPPMHSADTSTATSPPLAPTEQMVPTAQADPTEPPAPSASPLPTSDPTSAPDPTRPVEATPSAPSTPVQVEPVVLGYSVQDRPVLAYRIGQGPIKVVLVGDIHGGYEANTQVLTQALANHFRANPQQVPSNVSLWIIPTMNPDGLANDTRWNANNVDLNRNTDTDLDGCAGNDWSTDTFGLEGRHPGAGGPYPFSEPEAQIIRNVMDDAWIAVFYHSAAEAVYVDTCQRHLPTTRLAELVSDGTGYSVPAEGWAGYPVTGDFGDYLSGEGVAAVTVELVDHDHPEFDRNLKGVQAVLAGIDSILNAEANETNAENVWLDENTTGTWHYAENSFLHPLALEVLDSTGYLLDGGRVLGLNLAKPEVLQVLLSPGDEVEGTRVLEPLDLATDADSLLVLDRAGDVYRITPADGSWQMERYDRAVRDTYDHYYVALAATQQANYLLETSHEQVWRFTAGEKGAPWFKLAQGRDIDVSAAGSNVYVLTRNMNSPIGHLARFQDAREVTAFQPNLNLMHPRQIVATEKAVYVLDRGGRRVLALDPQSGALIALHQFTDRRAVSAIWADPEGERLLLAGRDAIFFFGEAGRNAFVEGGRVLEGPQPHNPDLAQSLRGLQVPIEGARVTSRDFQTPGAPRHYRLGVHEGLDFYGHTVGVTINNKTPVRAVADGIVIRALLDYMPLTAAQAEAWYAKSLAMGYTPADVLDGYRGRQVWIDHGNGIVSRYAHLSGIAPGIQDGAKVRRGQVIATVGNSGTPGSVDSRTFDVHLHLELWIGDHFAGQFLRPTEAREWLEKILR